MTETTLPPLAKPTALDSATPDVKDFIARHDLREEVKTAVRLAEEEFPEGSIVTLELQFMPDRGYDWLLVKVKMFPDVPTALACQQKLGDRWIHELPLQSHELMVPTVSFG